MNLIDKQIQSGLVALRLIDGLAMGSPFDRRIHHLKLKVLQTFYPSPDDDAEGDDDGPDIPDDDFIASICRCLDYLAQEAERRGYPSVTTELRRTRDSIPRLAHH